MESHNGHDRQALLEKLEKMKDRLEEIEQRSNSIPLDELFVPAFIQAHSRFSSFEEMLRASPFDVETQEDFDAIAGSSLDEFIDEETDFGSWEAMSQRAIREWIRRELGKG